MSEPIHGAPLVLRAMRLSDLPEVLLIERRSFATPWAEGNFSGLMRRPSATLIVAELDEAVAGYAVLWFAADEGELGNLAILPELRRRGLGRRLLDRAIEEATGRGARRLFLEVRESNGGARRLYEAAGFQLDGVRRGYYTAPTEDAVLMSLQVQNEAR